MLIDWLARWTRYHSQVQFRGRNYLQELLLLVCRNIALQMYVREN